MFTVTNQTLNQEKGNRKMVAKMYDVFTCPCSFSRQHSGSPKRKKLVFLVCKSLDPASGRHRADLVGKLLSVTNYPGAA